MAGLLLIGIPLIIVGASALYSLRSCTNCVQEQLWLLVPTAHPVGTIMFGALVTGSWLLVFGLRSIRIPLQTTKLFIIGTGFLSVGIIFLVWSVVTFNMYLNAIENPIPCYLCPGGYGDWYKSLAESFAVLMGIFCSLGTILLLMNWKRTVLHAHGYL